MGRWLVVIVAVGALALIPLGSAGASTTTAKRIAYITAGNELRTIGANGTGISGALATGAHNPSFSSDGEQIVYDDGANVWSVLVASGATTNACPGTDPALSPNRQKVAFVSGGDVVVRDLACGSGPTNDLGAGSSPAWSPDGTQVVYVSGGDLAIATITSDTTATTQTFPTASVDTDPSWSSDGSRIAYQSGGEIFVMNADGGNRQQLPSSGASRSSPSWAPDGDEVVYSTGTGLSAVSLGNGAERIVLNSPGAADPDWGLAVANKVPPTITPAGPLADGTVLSAGDGDWIFVTAISSKSYQWKRCSTSGTGCANIAGATAGTYQLTSADVGSTIRLTVTATTPDGSAPGTSAPTGVVAAAPPQNSSAPTISGTPPVVGGTLTASPGGWAGSNLAFTYQWQKCDANGTAASCANISGATFNTYTPVNENVGSTLRVLVTATNTLGTATAASQTTAVVASTKPVNTALPTISAFLALDGTVTSYTASPGTWTGAPTITYTYQWRRCDSSGANCADIAAAITSTYLPTSSADVGSRFRVAVTATNSFGTATATSDATNVLVGQPPVNSFRPSISGTETSGSVLFATNGTWTGSTPMTFTYDWRRCNASGGACVSIAGATAQSYVVQSTDVGSTIVIAVTARNAGGSATVVSGPTGVIQTGTGSTSRPAVSTPPTFTGVLARGQTLRATSGGWSGSTPMTFAYQWQRCETPQSTCLSIASATKTTYTLATADVGKRIRLLVTATNAAGSAQGFSSVSQQVAAKAPATGKTIKGTAKADRLTGTAGADTIHGNGGNDHISGAAGADKLYGDAGKDTINAGPGRDSVYGGSGGDTIQARDGERDVISCGGGRDTAVVDKTDVVSGCETVKRK